MDECSSILSGLQVSACVCIATAISLSPTGLSIIHLRCSTKKTKKTWDIYCLVQKSVLSSKELSLLLHSDDNL